MRYYLRTCVMALLFALLHWACNSATEKRPLTENSTDTVAITNKNIALPGKAMLKEIILNEKTVITGKLLPASPKIDKERYVSLSVNAIDTTAGGETGFKYHIVDTLLPGPGIKALLIGREYESENFIWIAIYDDQDKLIDHKTVYYDNAEGFLSVETLIKNNQLTITTFNEYAEQEKEKKITGLYHLNEHNKIVKL